MSDSDQVIWPGWKLTPPKKITSDGQEKRLYKRARERYQRLWSLLESLEQHVPGVITGQRDIVIPDAVTTAVFDALHQNTPPNTLQIAHNFLVKGLERGSQQLNWSVVIPSPLVTIARKPPAVTTASFAELHRWDAFVNAHDAFPSAAGLSGHALHKWLIGRWLFQLIREGVVLHKGYLEQLPDAFEKGVTLAHDAVFLTLEEGVPLATEDNQAADDNVSADQSSEAEPSETESLKTKSLKTEPSETPIEKEQRVCYRRLFLSPASQLLLLRAYQDTGNAWPRTAAKSRLPVAQCLMCYLKHIDDGASLKSISGLLSMAYTASSFDKPPLLNYYTSRANIAQSLRPSSWQRLTQRHVLTDTSADSSDNDVYLEFQEPAPSQAPPSNQLRQLRQLQGCLSRSLGGRATEREAISNIETFLSVSNRNGAMVTLLARWCLKLLQKGGRVKSQLAVSSVKRYLSAIGRSLVAQSSALDNLQTASADEWEALYENVLNSIKPDVDRATAQNRLCDFHHFLMDTIAAPSIDLESMQGAKKRVDVNIVTPAEFRRALDLIDDSTQPERFRTMQKLALILGYRLGLGRSECAGLLVRDVVYIEGSDTFTGELIIRSNSYRRGKSYAATRRLPLWLLMPDERAQLIEWVKRRQGETTTQQIQKQLLFCSSGSGLLLLNEKALFHPVQTALRTVSGDPNLRYHHLRHSFVSFTLLRLLERSPCELLPTTWLHDDHGDIALPNTGADISVLAGLAPLERPSRKRLWQLALWAGHASPEETLSTYSHLLDWVLGQTTCRHFNPMLRLDQQLTLLSFPTKTALTSWRNRRDLIGKTQASELLSHLQTDWQPFIAKDLLKHSWARYQPPAVNPLDNSLEASFSWPEATTIYQSLRLIEQQEAHGISLDKAIEQTARKFALEEEPLCQWVANGEQLMQRKTRRTNQQFSREENRNDRQRRVTSTHVYMPELYRCMAPPVKPTVLKETGQFFHRLLDWHQKEPSKDEESLITFRNHMQRSTGHIVLPNADAINSVRELLRPLRCFQHTYLVVEVTANAKAKRVKQHWSNATNIPHPRIELISTPSPSGHTRYWYGNAHLKITRDSYKKTEQPLWEAVRFAAFMTMLVLGLCGDDAAGDKNSTE